MGKEIVEEACIAVLPGGVVKEPLAYSCYLAACCSNLVRIFVHKISEDSTLIAVRAQDGA